MHTFTVDHAQLFLFSTLLIVRVKSFCNIGGFLAASIKVNGYK